MHFNGNHLSPEGWFFIYQIKALKAMIWNKIRWNYKMLNPVFWACGLPH
mgnify:CR=1 FL=1